MTTKRVQEAIDAIKRGEMVIMLDDEDRENEGDLVYAATFSSPEKVNFLASEAKGLICVALEKDAAKRLELNPMVPKNTSSYETAFTVSVDAKDATTGISAFERDMTIRLLGDPLTTADDLVRPGHIFPLIAKDGGVLNRIGHTEGSVDLCKLAGLAGVAVICEIMKADGTMARRDDLDIFAEEHDLRIVYISDLIEYRMQRESLVKETLREEVEFFGKKVEKVEYLDHLGRTHTVMDFGNVTSSANVKFHNISKDVAFLQNEEQFNGILKAIDYLKENGGLLVFIDNTLVNDTAIKEYGIGAQILKKMGVEKINLIATKKIKEFHGLGGFNLTIEDEVVLK